MTGASCGDYPRHPRLGLVGGRRHRAAPGLPVPDPERGHERTGSLCDLMLGSRQVGRTRPADTGLLGRPLVEPGPATADPVTPTHTGGGRRLDATSRSVSPG